MTRIIHPPIDGEGLTREREALGGPCPIYPPTFVQIIATIGLIGLVWFMACALELEFAGMSDITKLKPCPFCGTDLQDPDFPGGTVEGGGFTLSCGKCEATWPPIKGEEHVDTSDSEAIARFWNTRTDSTKDAEIARLEAENERMREALAPFADVYDKDVGDSEHPDEIFKPMMKYNHAPLIKIGDLKRAYIAVNPIDPAGGMPVEQSQKGGEA